MLKSSEDIRLNSTDSYSNLAEACQERAVSSVGRAPESHSGGRGFDSHTVHHFKKSPPHGKES